MLGGHCEVETNTEWKFHGIPYGNGNGTAMGQNFEKKKKWNGTGMEDRLLRFVRKFYFGRELGHVKHL